MKEENDVQQPYLAEAINKVVEVVAHHRVDAVIKHCNSQFQEERSNSGLRTTSHVALASAREVVLQGARATVLCANRVGVVGPH